MLPQELPFSAGGKYFTEAAFFIFHLSFFIYAAGIRYTGTVHPGVLLLLRENYLREGHIFHSSSFILHACWRTRQHALHLCRRHMMDILHNSLHNLGK